MRILKLAALILAFVALLLPSAEGRVLLKTPGEDSMPLCMRSISADVQISGQFASTTMNLSFQNESSDQMEAEFIYQLPQGAVATYFAYWAGDEKVVARIVEKEEARRIYDTVAHYWSRDPGLVEMAGKNTFRARVFPVMPDADLKVEIHIVQVLPSDSNGVTYSLPIYDPKQIDPLDSIDVKIHMQPDPMISTISTNYGIPVQKNLSGYTVCFSGKHFRPRKDLNVRIARKPEKMHVSLYSAPIDSGDGFFALALTPDHTLTNAAVTIDGVKSYDLSATRFRSLKAFQPLVVYGRYSASGNAVVKLTGSAAGRGITLSATVVFGSTPEPDNLASKLWAADRIRRLSASKANRARVIDISTRYGLPSKFASWLAMPKAEMKAYTRDHYNEQISAVMEPLRNAIRENKPDTVVTPLIDNVNELCNRIGLDPAEEMGLWFRYEMQAQLADMMAEGKDQTPEAQLLASRITGMFRLKIDWSSEEFNQFARQALGKLAARIVREKARDNPDNATIEALNARMSKLAAASGKDTAQIMKDADYYYRQSRPWELVGETIDKIKKGETVELSKQDTELLENSDERLLDRVKREVYITAYNIARAELWGKEDGYEIGDLPAELDRLCRYAGLNAADILRGKREDCLLEACRYAVQERSSHKPDKKQLLKAETRVKRLEQLLGHSADEAYRKAEVAEERTRVEQDSAASALFDTMANPAATKSKLNAAHARYAAACRAMKLDPGKSMTEDMSWRMASLGRELVGARSQPRPNAKQVADLENQMKSVQHRSGISIGDAMRSSQHTALWYAMEPIHDLLQAELSRPEPNKPRLMRLVERDKQIRATPEVKAGGQWRKGRDVASLYDQQLTAAVDLCLQSISLQKRAQAARSQGQDAKALELEIKREHIRAAINDHVGEMAYLARPGDPLITVNAPADARYVIAIMPDGEVKTLTYNADRSRWEVRFDIPAYAEEGRYPVQIAITLKDGAQKQLTCDYAVDLTPPTGAGTAVLGQGNRLRLEVTASADTARVAALLPWGERADLRTSTEPGKFYLVVSIPEGQNADKAAVTYVLTDKAHNRTTVKAEVKAE